MRNLYVDWLRGFSILSVLMTHLILSKQLLFFVPEWLAERVGGNGVYGVVVFFCVSGFLITTRSLNRWGSLDRIPLRDFYAMRAARILPLLLLFLVFSTCLYLAQVPRFVPADPSLFPKAIAYALTFQYDYFFRHGGNVEGLFAMGILWSLAIEEVFYLVFPLAMRVLKTKRSIVLLLTVLIVQAPISRSLFGFYSFLTCVDAIALGCLAAILAHRLAGDGWPSGRPLLLSGACILFVVIGAAPITDIFVIGPTLAGIGAATFLVGSSLVGRPTWEFSAPKVLLVPFAVFGVLSYELYLFHISYLQLDPTWFVSDPILRSAANMVILGGGAAALHLFFSEPMNRRIRRLILGRRAANGSAPATT